MKLGDKLYRTERSKSVISAFFNLPMLRVFPPISRPYEPGIRQQVEAGNQGKIVANMKSVSQRQRHKLYRLKVKLSL